MLVDGSGDGVDVAVGFDVSDVILGSVAINIL